MLELFSLYYFKPRTIFKAQSRKVAPLRGATLRDWVIFDFMLFSRSHRY